MRLSLHVLLAAALWAALSAPAAEIAGVKLPDNAVLAPNSAPLVLNGAGLRSSFMIKVYVIGLYLEEKKQTTEQVLALKGGQRIEIVLLRQASAQQLTDGLIDVMMLNNSEADLASLKDSIEEFRALLLSLKEVPKGTVFQIDYLPEQGTRLVVNGQPRGKPIVGSLFHMAVLRIWLGDKPRQPDLKDALLGLDSLRKS
ncbi:MAG: chalcone isomerase family protein [Burkholderiaceae bacterium]